jgi:hypothetical protein
MTDTAPAPLDDPQAYVKAHDDDVKKLARLTRAQLFSAWTAELASHHVTVVSGGPVLKDELIRAILEYRFPRLREAQEQYASAIASQVYATEVARLAMMLGTVQDGFLRDVLAAAHPAARRRLRIMLGDSEPEG